MFCLKKIKDRKLKKLKNSILNYLIQTNEHNESNRVVRELYTSRTRAEKIVWWKNSLYQTRVEFRAGLIFIKSSSDEFDSTQLISSLSYRVCYNFVYKYLCVVTNK